MTENHVVDVGVAIALFSAFVGSLFLAIRYAVERTRSDIDGVRDNINELAEELRGFREVMDTRNENWQKLCDLKESRLRDTIAELRSDSDARFRALEKATATAEANISNIRSSCLTYKDLDDAIKSLADVIKYGKSSNSKS